MSDFYADITQTLCLVRRVRVPISADNIEQATEIAQEVDLPSNDSDKWRTLHESLVEEFIRVVER